MPEIRRRDLFARNSIHKRTTFRPPGSSVRVLSLPALELPDIIRTSQVGAAVDVSFISN